MFLQDFYSTRNLRLKKKQKKTPLSQHEAASDSMDQVPLVQVPLVGF